MNNGQKQIYMYTIPNLTLDSCYPDPLYIYTKKEKYCAFHRLHRLSSSVMGRMMVFRPHKTIRVHNGKCISVNRLHAMRSISDKIRLWKKI